MNRTIIVGDIHLGKGVSVGKPGIGNAINSRVADQLRLLNWIFDQGVEYQIDRFIITGDIFEDVKPDPQLIVIFVDWLKRCEDSGIECHIIAGNHDIRRTGDIYISVLDVVTAAGLSNTTIYKNIHTIHTDGVSFTLLPFRDRLSLGCETVNDALQKIGEKLPYELLDIPYNNIPVLVGHLALVDSFYTTELGDAANELMCPYSMFEGYEYVWMGHVHSPQIMQKKPHVAHIGSMDLSDFGECKQTKILILFDPTQPHKEIPVPSRPLVRIKKDIGSGTDPTQFLLDLINKLDVKDAIISLEVKHLDPEGAEIDRDKVLSALFDGGAYHVSRFSESRNVAVVPEDKKELLEYTVDPKSAIKLYADMLEYEDEQERLSFLQFCEECVEEYYAKEK